MKKGVIGEAIRDRSLDWLYRLMDGYWLGRGCWAVIVFAAGYFGVIVLNILTR